MPGKSPDYSPIAARYDERYQANALAGVGRALASLGQHHACRRVLEVGCGTGHWLNQLRSYCETLVGLDLSMEMLCRAREKKAAHLLVRGNGGQLPFGRGKFDLVFCVNALCHFDNPSAFISEAHRLLVPGGLVVIIGSDPRSHASACWVYEYFAGTYDTDLLRFPSWQTIADRLAAEGFVEIAQRPVERIHDAKVGREMLSNPFLQKHSSSQLALLSDEAYAAGVRSIELAITEAEARGESSVFPFDVTLTMVSGRR